MRARPASVRWKGTMAEIVNLRRARKSKTRGEREKEAAANRTLYGTPKYTHDAAKAEKDRQSREHALHKIGRDETSGSK